MQTAFTIQHRYTQIKTTAIYVAITISIAAVYFGICEATPFVSKAVLFSGGFGKAIRFANVLRALVLVSPAAIIGTGIGATLFSIANGSIGFGAQMLVPSIMVIFGLMLNRFCINIEKPTLYKDLFVLSIYGLFTGLIVSFNNILLMISVGKFTNVVFWAVGIKLLNSMFTVMVGYPLVLAWRKLQSINK
jgi:hypothetical protein